MKREERKCGIVRLISFMLLFSAVHVGVVISSRASSQLHFYLLSLILSIFELYVIIYKLTIDLNKVNKKNGCI